MPLSVFSPSIYLMPLVSVSGFPQIHFSHLIQNPNSDLFCLLRMDSDADHSPTRSLKQRLRSTICFSCCFRAGAAADDDGYEEERPASLIRSSTVWLRSKAQELPEIGGKLASRIGRQGHHHRRHSGGDFRYDPLSYALNFDEGADVYDEDAAEGVAPEFRYRSFSSRLPATPPHPAPQPSRAPPVGIAC